MNDRRFVAQRFRGGVIRLASAARRVGRLGGRAQGCVERIFLDADIAGVHAICGGVQSPKSKVKVFYGLSLLAFACGLMSKPMVVTLPFVLLLIDFWPLNRFHWTRKTSPPNSEAASAIKPNAGLMLEKLPFFALAAAGSVATYLVQKTGGAVSNDTLPFRMANASWSYCVIFSRHFGRQIWRSFILFPVIFCGSGNCCGSAAGDRWVCSFFWQAGILACRWVGFGF